MSHSDDEDSYDESGEEDEEEEGWSDNGEEDGDENHPSTPTSARKKGASSSNLLKSSKSLTEESASPRTPRQKRGTLVLNQPLQVVSVDAPSTQQEESTVKNIEQHSEEEKQQPQPAEPHPESQSQPESPPLDEKETQLQSEQHLVEQQIDKQSTEQTVQPPTEPQQKEETEKQTESDKPETPGKLQKQASSFLPAQLPRNTDNTNPSLSSRSKTPFSIPIPPSETEADAASKPQTPTGTSGGTPRSFLGLARSISTRNVGSVMQGNGQSTQPKRASLGKKEMQALIGERSEQLQQQQQPPLQPKEHSLSVFDQVLEEYYQELKVSLGGYETKTRAVTLFFDVAIESLCNKNEAKRLRAESKLQLEPPKPAKVEPEPIAIAPEPTKEAISKLNQEITSLEKELEHSEEKEAIAITNTNNTDDTSEAKTRPKGSRLMNKSVNLTEALLELISPDSQASLDGPLPVKELFKAAEAESLPSMPSTANQQSPARSYAHTTAATTSASSPLQLNIGASLTTSPLSSALSSSTSKIPDLVSPVQPVSAAVTSASLPAVSGPVSSVSFKRVGHIGTNADGSLTFEGETVINALLSQKSEPEKLTKKPSLLNGLLDKMKTKKG
eukprot:TRINITY_DN16_c0_g7_i1.p1 TRINITY_DN16_c0_g7~~TRINITY_DN16_c0_g7_i1.p1  ORF type:complete len:615 (-),score=186.25 TRINITY_DN16_c0_g7_i1:62-1906(-)